MAKIVLPAAVLVANAASPGCSSEMSCAETATCPGLNEDARGDVDASGWERDAFPKEEGGQAEAGGADRTGSGRVALVVPAAPPVPLGGAAWVRREAPWMQAAEEGRAVVPVTRAV